MLSSEDLLVLLGCWNQAHRDLLAVNAGLLARAAGCDVTAYWAAPREGGIFAKHGGSVAAGRHHEALATLMATRRVHTLRCGTTVIFTDLVSRGGASTSIPADPSSWPTAFDELLAVGTTRPSTILLLPTEDLPTAIRQSVVSACAPLATYHQAWMLPLESTASSIQKIATSGMRTACAVTFGDDRALEPWRDAGFTIDHLTTIAPDTTPDALAFGIADLVPAETIADWMLAEPVLAAERLPGAVLKRTGLICAHEVDALIPALTKRMQAAGQSNIIARYGGGDIGRLSSDKALFPLFAADISVHVEEPGRPAFPCARPKTPRYPCCDSAPAWAGVDDDQLRDWARAGKHLLALVSHSGEQSHDECLPTLYDSAAFNNMHWGIGTHTHRVLRHPEAVEPMLTPWAEGGVRDTCECVLHSAGDGIIAERLADPTALAARMATNRDLLSDTIGPRDAPRGVLCYLDADPEDWSAPATGLWQALKEAGFDYVLSSVQPDGEKLLYRDGQFVVLPCAGSNCFPYSPFVRVHRAEDLTDRVAARQRRLEASYTVAVIDLPVIADMASLLHGDRYRLDHPTIGPLVNAVTRDARPFLITTTPAIVARYAAIVDAEDY